MTIKPTKTLESPPASYSLRNSNHTVYPFHLRDVPSAFMESFKVNFKYCYFFKNTILTVLTYSL